jgi:hypothetical protein
MLASVSKALVSFTEGAGPLAPAGCLTTTTPMTTTTAMTTTTSKEANADSDDADGDD